MAINKRQLADDICKVLFGGNFVYADRQGEEENPEHNNFERMGYVKVRYSNGNTDREQVTFSFDYHGWVSFDWSCFDPFNLEGKDTMAAFLTGLMYGLTNGKAKTAEYVRAQNYISFAMPDTEAGTE